MSVRVEAGGWALQKAVGKKKCLFYTVAVMLDQPGLLEPAHTRATFYLSVAEARRVEVHQNFRKTRTPLYVPSYLNYLLNKSMIFSGIHTMLLMVSEHTHCF